MLRALLAACLFAFRASVSWADGDAPPLRVCADPDNLPFSSNGRGDRGMYLDLAQQIADRLGRPMEPVWTPLARAKRTIHSVLLAGHCDMMVGLPANLGFMAPALVVSVPLVDVGYALVTPTGAHISDLADLSGLRVVVEFDSIVQDFVAEHSDITPVTVLTVREGMEALARRRADAALLWGPEAGYLNRTKMSGAYRVTPLSEERFHYQAGIGFAARNEALRNQINAIVAQKMDDIRRLADKYGFPRMRKGAAPDGKHSEPLQPALGYGRASAGSPTSDASSTRPLAAPDPSLAEAGRSIFNSVCYRCHGHDAMAAAKRGDLRRLRYRYGDSMDEVFYAAVADGRPSKGMPPWKGVYTPEEFRQILSFLRAIQEDQ